MKVRKFINPCWHLLKHLPVLEKIVSKTRNSVEKSLIKWDGIQEDKNNVAFIYLVVES